MTTPHQQENFIHNLFTPTDPTISMFTLVYKIITSNMVSSLQGVNITAKQEFQTSSEGITGFYRA